MSAVLNQIFTKVLSSTCCMSKSISPEDMVPQLPSITTLSLEGNVPAPDMIDILRETTDVTTFKIEVDSSNRDIFKALTLDGKSEDSVLLPKLGVMRVRMFLYDRVHQLSVMTAFVEMVASRSPSSVEALGVAPLEDVCVGLPSYQNTLKVDVSAVLEQWDHKTDMLQIRYEEYSNWG